MADIYSALNELLNHQDIPLDTVLDRYFSPEYVQRTNGVLDDRDGFRAHATKLREVIASAEIEVLVELRDGPLYADRHRLRIFKRDGSETIQEVHLFAELDPDDRFARIDETTLQLEGSEADRGLGRIR